MNSPKTKLIIFIDWFYPAHKAGGPIRSVYNIIEAIYKEVDVHIVTSAYDIDDSIPMSSIQPNKWINNEKYQIIYLEKKNQTRKKYKSIFLQIKPDVIYLNSLFSLGFTIKPLLAKGEENKTKIILAPRGMLKPEALAIKPYKKKLFLELIKITNFFKGINWHASSKIEELEIYHFCGESSRVSVAQNLTTLITKRPDSRINKKPGELKLIFFSRINPIKNLDFIIHVLIEMRNKSVSLEIYGPIEDKEYWFSCQLLIDDNNLNVRYKGILSQFKKEELLWDYDFLILPTKGENFGHVIAESLSASLPVIISQNTPWRNLSEFKAGFDLKLEKNIFRDVLITLIDMDQKSYQEFVSGSKSFSDKFIVNQNVVNDNKNLFLND